MWKEMLDSQKGGGRKNKGRHSDLISMAGDGAEAHSLVRKGRLEKLFGSCRVEQEDIATRGQETILFNLFI